MKKLIILMLLAAGECFSQVDSLSLEQCYRLAFEHSPLSRQKQLFTNSADISKKALNSGYLPQMDLNAQASYQSDVTKIPISMPGLTIEPLSKDQYKATIDFRQVIFDGNYIRRQKQLQESSSGVEIQKVEVDIQKLREQVNGFYLSILLLDENIRIVESMKNDISTNIEKMSAMVQNGTAMLKNLNVLEAELLKTGQKLTELRENRKTVIDMLSVIMGTDISGDCRFMAPAVAVEGSDIVSNRPEFRLFDLQKENLSNQSRLIACRNMPKLSLFATGGKARPALNMLNNDFDWYYYTGVRFTMPLTSWTSTRHERKVIEIQKTIIDNQKENFSTNNQVLIRQQLGEIEKFKLIIEADRDIIKKRDEVKLISEAQLQNGVISSNDYLIDLNAGYQSELNLKLHEVQLIQAKITYQSLLGNY